MDACPEKDVHDRPTNRGHLTYCFTAKHRGAGSKTDARWSPELTRPEEFAVFDLADENRLVDEEGNLYGLHIRQIAEDREILPLGDRGEMIARFWAERGEAHWHGHPLWPVITKAPLSRISRAYAPPKVVFDEMIQAGILTKVQADRLKKARPLRNL